MLWGVQKTAMVEVFRLSFGPYVLKVKKFSEKWLLLFHKITVFIANPSYVKFVSVRDIYYSFYNQILWDIYNSEFWKVWLPIIMWATFKFFYTADNRHAKPCTKEDDEKNILKF